MRLIVDSAAGARRFRTGVSLHSHTLHSRETLGILYALRERSAFLNVAVRRIQAAFRSATGTPLNLHRGWWTPPLSPRQAWQLERAEIENSGLSALVSITDHDNIDGPLSLRALEESKAAPISVEWTVPFQNTFFHVGVHDLPHRKARTWMNAFAECTANGGGSAGDLLEALTESTDALVILNHPCWDESGIGAFAHEESLRSFLARFGPFVHALELNGLRPWSENRRTLALAKTLDQPVISGGDRHGFEPNTVLNLTRAATFSEFAEEIRSGHSNVLVTDRYREVYALRVMRNFEEMSAELNGHAHGWRHWSERVFYEFEDGPIRSMREIFGGRMPPVVEVPLRLLKLTRFPGVDRAIHLAVSGQQRLIYD
jgi:hypothetical protein